MNDHEAKQAAEITHEDTPLPQLILRSGIGGTLMGLANLVPGISGGTMLLASGIYPLFITAISDVTRFRFRKASLVVLSTVTCVAMLAFVLLAGPIKTIIVDYRWAMFALFIGLTLGGIPVVWSLIKKPTPAVWSGAAVGFLIMAILAYLQTQQTSTGDEAGWIMMIVAGIAGASAMILPGVSGAYLFLMLGVYLPVLDAISKCKEAVSARDLALLQEPLIQVVIPVGIGVVIGIVAVSNALRWCLERYEKSTLGVLLGLLVGAVVGLWPFEKFIEPQLGDMYRGSPLDAAGLAKLLEEKHKWATAYFTPTASQIVIAILLIVLGFAITAAIAWFGKDRKKPADNVD